MAFHSKSLQHQTYKTCFNLTRSHYLSCFSRKRLFEVQTRKRKHSSTNCRRKTKGRLSFMTFITNFLIWYMLIGFTICEMRSLCDSARGWKTSGHDCLLRGFALPLSYRSRLRMVETSKQKCLKKNPHLGILSEITKYSFQILYQNFRASLVYILLPSSFSLPRIMVLKIIELVI